MQNINVVDFSAQNTMPLSVHPHHQMNNNVQQFPQVPNPMMSHPNMQQYPQVPNAMMSHPNMQQYPQVPNPMMSHPNMQQNNQMGQFFEHNKVKIPYNFSLGNYNNTAQSMIVQENQQLPNVPKNQDPVGTSKIRFDYPFEKKNIIFKTK